MREVAELRAGEVRADEAVAEKIEPEEVVESEVVVTAEELRADREKNEWEAREKKEGEKGKEGVDEGGPDDVEEGVGSDKVSWDTQVLESEKKTEAIEEEGKEPEESEGDCVEVTKETVEVAQVGGKGMVGKAERRRKRFSNRLAKVIASGEVKVKVEKVDKMRSIHLVKRMRRKKFL